MLHIFYSGSNGSSSPELDTLIIATIPELLTRSDCIVDTWLYSPSSPHDADAIESNAERIKKADVFIGEMSRASQTLGFELAFALMNAKPCLYLYHESRDAHPGTALLQNPSRLLKIKSYNKTNLETIIKKFIIFSTHQMDSSRTSFMSTKKIDSTLKFESQRRGISQSEIIREVLDKYAQSVEVK